MVETLVGVGAGAILSGIVAVVLWRLNSRTELEKTQLLIDAQTEQARYPDLVRAASEFADEMRRLRKVHNEHAETRGVRLVDEWSDNNSEDVARDAPTAELNVLTLEFFADDPLVRAARAWLEAFYVVWYDDEPRDVEARRAGHDSLRDAEKRYVTEVRRSLKVAEPVRI